MIWRWRWLVVGVVLVATVGTYALSKMATKQYRAQTQVQARAQSVDTALTGSSDQGLTDAQNLAAAARTADTPRVAGLAAGKLTPPPRQPLRLLDQVKVSTDEDALFLIIKATDPSPRRAAAIANAFAAALIEARAAPERARIDRALAQLIQQRAALPPSDGSDRRDLSDQIDRLRGLRAAQGLNDQVVQPAIVPRRSVSPRPARNAAVAFLVSGLIAIGLAFLLHRLDRRLGDSGEVTAITGVPLLGEIPSSAFSDAGSHRADMEAFRMLHANLTYFDSDRPLKSVLVASPLKEDGKTTVATKLARAAAQVGKDVVLVDTDLRHAQTGAGLGSVLAGDSDLADVLQEMDVAPGRLRIVPTGQPPPNPASLIGSDGMRALLARLTQEADLVVIDTPPMLVVSDAIPLLEQTSGIILVARLGWTTRDAIGRLREVVSNTRGALLGVVVTGAKPAAQYDYGAYGATEATPNVQVPAGAAPSKARQVLRALGVRR